MLPPKANNATLPLRLCLGILAFHTYGNEVTIH
jgi:hypothetical protein